MISSIFDDVGKQNYIMVGLDWAGKTTILNQLNLGESQITLSGLGYCVETVKYKEIKIDNWDVGGSKEKYFGREFWKKPYYNANTHLIFVVDSSDRPRIHEASEELKMILNDEYLNDKPILIWGNKQDVPGGMSPHEIVEELDLISIDESRVWHFQPCCAISGDGLFEGLDWLSKPNSSNHSRFLSTKSAKR